MSDPLHGNTGHSPSSTHRDLEKPNTQFHDLEAARGITRSRDGDGDLGHQAPPISQHGFYGHIGNPGLVGLAAHAVTLMLLATSFMQWRGVTAPTAYVGNLFFFAGLYMFTAFNWCLVKGETFAATVFGVFSGFYLSYGAILTPAFNVAASYSGAAGTATDLATEYNSLATFLLVWNGAFTCIWIASLRTNVALMIVFLGVILGVWLLAGMYIELARLAQVEATGSMGRALALSKAGGAWLFISACSGFWLCLAQFLESVDMPFTLPVGDLTRFWPKKKKVD